MLEDLTRLSNAAAGHITAGYALIACGLCIFTFYILKSLGGRKLNMLRSENRRLKKLIAELMLDVTALKETRGRL